METNLTTDDDLYKHIRPPIPLLDKSKYIDDTASSYQPFMYLLNSHVINPLSIEVHSQILSQPSPQPLNQSPLISLQKYIEDKEIVYKRNPLSQSTKPDLLNLGQFIYGEPSKKHNYEPIRPYYTTKDPHDKTLIFESRFESGNLWMALKTSTWEYDLILSNDVNNKGNTQWFYFQVSNTVPGQTVKFNIINLCKSGSLYNNGMRVFYREERTGWKRGGFDIKYSQNNFKRNKKGKTYFSLSFSFAFEKSDDVVYFAYSQPYTYTNLMEYLKSLEADQFKKKIIRRRLLTRTISGNRCDVLTITAPGYPEDVKNRKVIVISARVHPGETVASWMMHGVLDFLTSSTSEAILLRENFVFYIIPMLNPDGVINGNYRCNLSGADLNRRWLNPLKTLHPTIYAAKRLIKMLSSNHRIDLICDLHGHSRRHNIFMYGCELLDNPRKSRAYPYILSSISRYFYYKSCCFRVQRSKASTMRVALFTELKSPFIYTLEASFGGCDFGVLKGMHMTSKDLQNMGKELCLAILINNKIDSLNCSSLMRESILKELEENEEVMIECDNEDDSGSESEPSEDELTHKQVMKLLEEPAKKTKKNSLLINTSVSPNRERLDNSFTFNLECSNSTKKPFIDEPKQMPIKTRRQLVLAKPSFLISKTRENSVIKEETQASFFPKLELSFGKKKNTVNPRSSQTEFPCIVKREEKPAQKIEKIKSSKLRFDSVEEKNRPVCKYSLFTYEYSFI